MDSGESHPGASTCPTPSARTATCRARTRRACRPTTPAARRHAHVAPLPHRGARRCPTLEASSQRRLLRDTCHKEEASEYTRAEFQSWIDEKRATVSAASDDATRALQVAAAEYGLASWSSFIAAQPRSGAAAGLSSAKWGMLQRAAQNADFVINDGSGGIHNPDYAMAGLDKALLWARSASATVEATLPATPHDGSGMTVHGSVVGLGGAAVVGAEVSLESSVDGGATWSVVETATSRSGWQLRVRHRSPHRRAAAALRLPAFRWRELLLGTRDAADPRDERCAHTFDSRGGLG